MNRYHGLDLARAVFMFLGVFYHSAVIYKVNTEADLVYRDSNIVFNYLTEFIHDFRMDAFYLLAGFFFVLVVERYGKKTAILTRVVRLGVPLVFIGFTFNYFINSFMSERNFTFDLNYIIDGDWLDNLWFIGNLIIYNIVSLLFISAFINKQKVTINKKLLSIFIFIIVPFLSLLLGFLGRKFFGTHFVFISFQQLFVYFPYYLLGMLIYMYRQHFVRLLNIKFSLLLLSLYLAIKIFLQLFEFNLYLEAAFAKVGSTFLVFAIIGIFNFIAKESKTLDKYVDSSYTIYLLHQTLIIYLFPFIVILNFDPIVSFLVLSLSVFFLSHFVHHKIIKNSPKLMFLFNGIYPKKPMKSSKI